MSTAAVLLVTASVIQVQSGLATIDQGSAAGLESGDRGRAFYELLVDDEPKPIEAGTVKIVATETQSATVVSLEGTPLRPGYQVEFQIPRRTPAVPVPPQKTSSDVGEGLVPSQPIAVNVEDAGEVLAPAPSIPVDSGRYAIGLDLGEAEFFNQTPRHEVLLTRFSIDRSPVGKGLAFSDAQAHCQNLGMRLPTEQEWEVAAQQPGFATEPGLFEWTDSWYQAYPGNTRSEQSYGSQFRVLRGAPADGAFDPRARRFMPPDHRNANVGFRCARDAS